jgi:hypothetical protein
LAAICAVALASAASSVAGASVAISGVFAGHTMDGAAIPCVTETGGVRVCHGDESGSATTDLRFKSFDGTPLEVWVTLPAVPKAGPDGDFPLIIQSHGWAAPTDGPTDGQYGGPTALQWAAKGVAVLQFDARGWGGSCGTNASRKVDPSACQNGYIRLDDMRYEVRDVQYAAGVLVDEGIVNPNKIGANGESYGGGVTVDLATLKNRVMNANGTLSPWTSPDGTPLHIAAAAPFATWSDLVYALAPNGHFFDSQVASPTTDLDPVGVEKLSVVAGLWATGLATDEEYYPAPGVDPSANLTQWLIYTSLGEPYSNPLAQQEIQSINEYRSPYYILDGSYGRAMEAPAPLFWANGFTDDIFPVDEALRYFNLERKLYPKNPISLFFFDGGHQRGSNKAPDLVRLHDAIEAFFLHYLKGVGAQPKTGITASTQTCPKTAPSAGPWFSSTWAGLHPGVVNYSSAPTQTVLSEGGNPVISTTFDPVGASELSPYDGEDWACQTVSALPAYQGPGIASYDLPTPTGAGYTLLGSPTVTADLTATGLNPYIVARLVDVDQTTDKETLVAHGIYRLNPNAPDGQQTFQLYANGWRFAPGHFARLELLGEDAPYTRPANGVFTISVSHLKLVLPVHDVPGAPGVSSDVVKPQGVDFTAHTICIPALTSTIRRKKSRASHTALMISGSATESACAHANDDTERVYVSVSRQAAGGQCKFLTADGRLSRPRSCSEPIELPARGAAKWQLRLKVRLASGTYTVTARAIDKHKARSRVSTIRLVVRQ